MIGIVVSEADPASVTIGDGLLAEGTWETHRDDARPVAAGGGVVHRSGRYVLRTFEELHLHIEGVASAFDNPDAIVFVSKHAGDTGPLLTTHVPGNVGRAEHGGTARTLPPAAPALMHDVFDGMRREAPAGYEVGIECTHHGPTDVGVPTIFAEIGSDPAQWDDEDAGRAVARAILAAEDVPPTAGRIVVGVGGGHYAPRFARILRDTGWHVGHVAADWSLAELDGTDERRRVVERAIDRSAGDVVLVAGDHPELRGRLTSADTPVVDETWLREVDGVSLDLVDRVETLLGPIEEGTRIGRRRPNDPDSVRYGELPAALVEAVNGHDHEAVVAAVAERAVGLATRENGKRITGPLALSQDVTVAEIARTLEPILAERFASVAFEEGMLILEVERFDPERARTLGVSEGPAFGRLSNGEAVTVDGETVEPESVLVHETRQIPLDAD